MPVTVRILEWQAVGLRCPDHTLTFGTSDHVHPISLVQMPNGVGKTTTLELLRAALDGTARARKGFKGKGWDAERVQSFRKRAPLADEGEFRVVLLCDEKRTTIRLCFDFVEGRVNYVTTNSGSRGQTAGFRPSRELRPFLRPEFVRLFVFDGELAHQLLSREHTNAQAAIEDLFHLDKLSGMVGAIDAYWATETEDRTATRERGLVRRENDVEKIERRLRVLRQEQQELSEERDRQAGDLRELDGKFSAQLEASQEVSEKLAACGGAVQASQANVRGQVQAVVRQLREPHALCAGFAAKMISLRTCFDRAQLPESAAREWFHELATLDRCVCGRPLDESTRQAIRGRASQYLGSSDVSILNAIKSDLAERVEAEAESASSQLTEFVSVLVDYAHAADTAQNDLDYARTQASRRDPDLLRTSESIAKLKVELDRLAGELERFDDPTDLPNISQVSGIGVLERRLGEARRKLDEIRGTVLLRRKCEGLKGLLASARRMAEEKLATKLCVDANRRIRQLMPHNRLQIEEIRDSLRLRGQAGGSVGETLAVAYAFLSCLFNRSDHELPFVVDSPAGPIDLGVRRNVAELIPRLSGQFIALVISSERQHFVPELERAAADPLHYVTVFRKSADAAEGQGDHEGRARQVPAVAETVDGLCVPGGDFFSTFQLDEEVRPDV